MNKNLLIPLIIIISGIFIGSALLFSENNKSGSLNANVAQANLKKLNLEIKGMFCIGCRASIVKSLESTEGIIRADADPKTDSGWVIYDPLKITKEEILSNKIFKIYPARIISEEDFKGKISKAQSSEIPKSIQTKLNILVKRVNEGLVELDTSSIENLNKLIENKNWKEAEKLLDEILKNYEK